MKNIQNKILKNRINHMSNKLFVFALKTLNNLFEKHQNIQNINNLTIKSMTMQRYIFAIHYNKTNRNKLINV